MKLTKDQQQSLTNLMKPQNAILLIPCLLAGPTLIAVLLYEVIQYKTLSESDKESLHTAEYILSFLSSLVLFAMVFYSIIGSLKYLSFSTKCYRSEFQWTRCLHHRVSMVERIEGAV